MGSDKSPFDLPTEGAEVLGTPDPPEVAAITDVSKIRGRNQQGVQTLSGNAPPKASEKGVEIHSRIDHEHKMGIGKPPETKITPNN